MAWSVDRLGAAAEGGEVSERWKKTYVSEFYEVSDLGRVRSLRKQGQRSALSKTPRLKALKKEKNGYVRVSLCENDKNVLHLVHRLVLTAFSRPPHSIEVCNHRNGDKSDNRLSNLEWCTPRENAAHSVRTGLHPHGSRSHYAKLTEDNVRQIKTLLSGGNSQRKIARMFGVRQGTISFIAKGETWSHV